MALQRPASITDSFLEQLVARVPSTSGGSWKLTEVYTGDLLVELPQSTTEDVAAAYATARKVQKEWAARPLKERLAVFKRAHTLFIDNAQTTTDLIQVESGKNRRMAIEETCDPVMVMSHYLKRAPHLLKPVKRGGPVPLVSSSTEIRHPKGIIGIIAPWNFPFATGISDSISALMAGNGIVLKPDNKTALSPLYGVWAAWAGDRRLSARLYEEGYAQLVGDRYLQTLEMAPAAFPDKPRSGPFFANLGGFLMGLMYGLTGLRVGPGDPAEWPQRRIVLPAGWESIEIERAWIRQQPARIIARQGDARATVEVGVRRRNRAA